MLDQEEKQKILETAARRFFEYGISKVTIDEVAADLGMSKKTIYKHFPSKDELLLATVRMNMERVGKEVTSITNSGEPFEKKIAALLLVVGRQVRRISPQFQTDMRRFSPELWKEIDTFRREQVIAKLQLMFVQAKQEKYFREDLNVELFYLVLLNAAQGIINPQTLSEYSFSAVKAFQEIIKILFEGALTAEARQRVHLFDAQFEQQLSQRTI
jgi:AcrR family transcriptional regulator